MKLLLPLASIFLSINLLAQVTVLKPDQVFDGEQLHKNWIVVIEGANIKAAGLAKDIIIPKDTKNIDLN